MVNIMVCGINIEILDRGDPMWGLTHVPGLRVKVLLDFDVLGVVCAYYFTLHIF